MHKILVIETCEQERERISVHLSCYLGKRLGVFFANTIAEALVLLQNRDGWISVVFGNSKETTLSLVQFVRTLIQTMNFDRQGLVVLCADINHRVQLVFAGCHKEVQDEVGLGDVLGKTFFNIPPPFRRRARKITI